MFSFKSIITYIKTPFVKKKEAHPASRNMALGANGGWMDPAVKTPQPNPISKPLVTPLSSYDTPWWNSDLENNSEILNSPPTYFPHGNQLNIKLEQCLDIGIISACIHKSTGGRIYHLDIELPCTKDISQDMGRFNLFIKAMEEQYSLALIQQERVVKDTCYGTYYRVVFEYDPNKLFLKTREKTRR